MITIYSTISDMVLSEFLYLKNARSAFDEQTVRRQNNIFPIGFILQNSQLQSKYLPAFEPFTMIELTLK